MKTLINYFILIPFAIFTFACDDDDPVINLHVSSNKMDFLATGILKQTYGYHPQPRTEEYATVVLLGSGECPQMPAMSMEITHSEFYEHDDLKIESGKFKLKGSHGEEIFGVYYGEATMLGAQMQMQQVWTIEGGKGNFRAAEGTLNAKLLSTDNHHQQFEIRVSGIISL